MARTEFYKRTKGPMAENEDWWYLVDGDNGEKLVEHEWDHVRINGLARNSGSNTYTIQAFLDGDHNSTAKAALMR